MRKYFNKKIILLVIALVYVFFAGFKFFKGKSFFDTIVEYSNNIHSINAEIRDVDRSDYILTETEYIPVEYTDYKQINLGSYIIKKENENNLYIYDSILEEEILFEQVDEKVYLNELTVNDKWAIWSESEETEIEEGIKNLKWSVYVKKIQGGKKTLVETGTLNLKGKNSNNSKDFIPKEMVLDGDNLIYTKYNENVINNGNVEIKTIMTSIIKYDLNIIKSEFIDVSYDNNKEGLYDIKIDKDNIIWQKIYKDSKTERIIKAEVYKYSIKNASKEKLYESSAVENIDINGDNVVIVAKNPEDNILIYNLKDKSFINLFYRGSRIEKMFRVGEKPMITGIEFIDDSNILIGVSSEKLNISTLVYNLNDDIFINFDNYMQAKEKTPLMMSTVDGQKLLVYLGIVEKSIEQVDKKNTEDDGKTLYTDNDEVEKTNETFIDSEALDIYRIDEEMMNEEDTSSKNIKIDKENVQKENIYYKYYKYTLR
ncbi:MAG: hypothetical protein ACRC6T_09145 [Sarcina sp.]